MTVIPDPLDPEPEDTADAIWASVLANYPRPVPHDQEKDANDE